MAISSKFAKVSEAVTISRYDNGFMVELNGRDKKGDWLTIKTVCTKEQEVVDLFKEYNTIPLDQ